MAYRFQVNEQTCINCGICVDLCPVRCLDMTRPTNDGTLALESELSSPIPLDFSSRGWMMLAPIQVDACIGCQVCAQECPTNAIIIQTGVQSVSYARRGPVAYLPSTQGWQPLDAYTRASPEEPGESPWGTDHAWHVAERQQTWQSWRSWLGERKEDLRAPCQAACPVGTNAGLYVSLIAQGRYEEALQVAAEPNPFPAICGRVCTAPCEAVCRRGEFDQPIAIRDLKRFATDHGSPWQRKVKPPRHHYADKVAIIGAGPTGLSAAYYLGRRGYPVTVFDAMPVAGGMMAIGIPDYRLPRVELNRDIDAIRSLGVELRLNTAIGRDITLDALQLEYDAVLIAVGAQRSQRLGIPGEELQGVIPATTFLKQFNLVPETRISGEVMVIGGGSTALDAARSALRAGASKVHILYRRTQAEMPAQEEEVRAALEEGIELHELAAPVQLLGSEGRLVSIRCQRMQPEDPPEASSASVKSDALGRRRVIPIDGSEFELLADAVLVAIGEAPDPSFLPEGTSVVVSAWGGLLVNPETLATGAPGIFAAGDITYGPKTVIHAAAHGRKAARAIHAYLQHLSPQAVAELPEDEFETASVLPADGTVTLNLHPSARAVMPLRTSEAARDRSVEFAAGFSEEQARREASRCLRCDLAYLCPSVKLVKGADQVGHQSADVPAGGAPVVTPVELP
jgi:NADPH-dependent glutamate synthase beta subunit-like oxidoreductase/NAD-dependent dihydropyrimidine dehydrogenase PreA subunit